MPSITRKLKRKLKSGDTAERCGLVLVNDKVVETANTHDNPEKGFRIPVTEMRDAGAHLAGTWHTHPEGTANLSQEDYLGFGQWPGYTHYIVSQDEVRAFIADDTGLITEVDLAAD